MGFVWESDLQIGLSMSTQRHLNRNFQQSTPISSISPQIGSSQHSIWPDVQAKKMSQSFGSVYHRPQQSRFREMNTQMFQSVARIIIFSKFLMFLDLVHEMISRHTNQIYLDWTISARKSRNRILSVPSSLLQGISYELPLKQADQG